MMRHASAVLLLFVYVSFTSGFAQEAPPKRIEPMPMARPPADIVITEVLFRVPRGDSGDANGDGRRNATGDEFIEIANLGEKPVNIGGYRLIDSNSYAGLTDKGKRPFNASEIKADGKGVSFVFPELELAPGEVVVLFNGFEGLPPGDIGTWQKAAAPNPRFGTARVFALRPEDKFAALGDKGDWVMLITDSGEILETVRWGSPETQPPADSGHTREAPTEPPGSVARRNRTSGFQDHAELYGGALFSPGSFVPKPSDPGTAVSRPREQNPR